MREGLRMMKPFFIGLALFASSTILAAPADAAGWVSFTVAGDICDPAAQTPAKQTGDLMRAQAGVIATLGDNQYQNGTLSEYRSCYNNAWGSFIGRTYPVPGNHEYNTSGAAGYFDYFGARARERGKGYYRYNVGDHWIALAVNTELTGTAMSTQVSWLAGVMTANASKNFIVYGHRARCSSGPHGNDLATDPLVDRFYALGGDVAIFAHDHHYERFGLLDNNCVPNTKGTRFFVVGTGGAGLRALGPIKAGSEA